MGLEVPKQFTLVEDKPIIIYTLEAFQDHPCVDSIGVVCIDGWHEILSDYVTQFGITKLDWIISGGASAQESIFKGVLQLRNRCRDDETIIIHDGIRPLVDPGVVSDVLAVCSRHGNAVTSLPYNEQIFRIDPKDPTTTLEYIPRETLRRVSTPQAYRYDVLHSSYVEAFEKGIGIGPTSYTNTMMVDLGIRLHFAAGSDKNIKLTTPDDLALFHAYVTGLTRVDPIPEGHSQ
jgi:2-C-methyl-D-erythritol 4-phosphate cytidylyltransferase